MDQAILPVEGEELILDLVEQGPLPSVSMSLGAGDGEIRTVGPRCLRSAEHIPLDSAHGKPAIAEEGELVRQLRDQVEAASRGNEGVGTSGRIEAIDVEADTAVLDFGDQVGAIEEEADHDILSRPAVAHGVAHRFLDGQHDVVDGDVFKALLMQVVADALAGAPQASRVEGKMETKAGPRHLSGDRVMH